MPLCPYTGLELALLFYHSYQTFGFSGYDEAMAYDIRSM
jgi:hypothetical protein